MLFYAKSTTIANMKQTITKILQEYEIIDFALLFGSYASEKQGFLSDIDIAIFTKNDIDIFMLGEIIASLQDECGKKISRF